MHEVSVNRFISCMSSIDVLGTGCCSSSMISCAQELRWRMSVTRLLCLNKTDWKACQITGTRPNTNSNNALPGKNCNSAPSNLSERLRSLSYFFTFLGVSAVKRCADEGIKGSGGWAFFQLEILGRFYDLVWRDNCLDMCDLWTSWVEGGGR